MENEHRRRAKRSRPRPRAQAEGCTPPANALLEYLCLKQHNDRLEGQLDRLAVGATVRATGWRAPLDRC